MTLATSIRATDEVVPDVLTVRWAVPQQINDGRWLFPRPDDDGISAEVGWWPRSEGEIL